MARTINCNMLETIGVEECFEKAVETIDPKCIDSIVSVAPQLKMLSNNSNLIAEYLCAQLKDFSSIDYGGLNYSPNSFILSEAHDNIIIRANIWRPLCVEVDRQPFEAALFAYHRAHNHNFHFLTVGHFGPGYVTDIYRYNRDKMAGFLDEEVELEHVERTTLTKGKVMLYEAGKDVHTQHPSESVSISLNLIVIDDDDRIRDQFFFDTEKRTISAFSDTLASKRVSLLRIAAVQSNDNTIDVMEHLAAEHPCHRTRLQAYKSLLLAEPQEIDRWMKMAARDSNVMVRSVLHAAAGVANPQTTFDPAFMSLV